MCVVVVSGFLGHGTNCNASVSSPHIQCELNAQQAFTHYNERSWEGISRPDEHIAITANLTSRS
jgi:hypothetical protein